MERRGSFAAVLRVGQIDEFTDGSRYWSPALKQTSHSVRRASAAWGVKPSGTTAEASSPHAEHYRQLEAARRGDLDISAWLVWFPNCLEETIRDARRQLRAALDKAPLRQRINQHPLNERQRKIIDRLLDNFQGHLTTSKSAKLTKCSNDTALRDIRDLLARAIIVRNPGGGRSTSYRLESVPVPTQGRFPPTTRHP